MASPRSEIASGRHAALFGKLPSTLDFVRVNHSTPEAVALDTWIQAAMQQLARHDASWPALRVRFAFRPKACASTIAGVIAPSRDRAGRSFPIALSAPLAGEAPQGSFAAVVLGAERFFQEAELLLDALPSAERGAWSAQVEALSPPLDTEIKQAQEELANEMSRSTAGEFLGRLSPPASSLDAEDLSRGVLRALSELREQGTEKPVVLHCAARTMIDAALCAALVQHLFAPSVATPSIFWSTLASSPRTLLSLGAPPANVPLWLTDARVRSNTLRALFQEVAPELSDTGTTEDASDGGIAKLSLRDWLTSLPVLLRR
jgi:type VI secretion system ImpM family protein